jgi:SAM-dependent methyltransferase
MTDVMICRSAPYAKFDVREHVPGKILAIWPASGPADATESGVAVSEFLPALADPGYWSDVDCLVPGKSLHQWLPPVLQRSLLRAGEVAAGRPLRGSPDDMAQTAAPQPIEDALATWLVATVRDIDGGALPLAFSELRYLVVSGGYRSAALAKVLHAIAPGKRFANIADVGAGIGMIPLLLSAEPAIAVRSVCLVEPRADYVQTGRALWSRAAGPGLSVEFQQNSAEAAILGDGRDAIFFGQCFYLIKESQRNDVVARVSQALAADGSLIVNEAVRSDPGAPDPQWDARNPKILRLPELVDALSAIGEVSVLRHGSDWQQPEDPRALSASEIGFDSFFAVGRR